MQRLTTDDRERGAVAVVVALLMVPLIGFAALAIDVASMWSQQQRLQVAADASALAIAQDCARQACGSPSQTATSLTAANFGAGGTAIVTLPAGQTKVTVHTITTSQHLFAPVLGLTSREVGAATSAAWGAPSGGTTVLPITFSWCDFKAQTGGGLPSQTTERIIQFTKDSGSSCTGPSNLAIPGGFGWVTPNAAGCMVASAIAARLNSDTGNSLPNGCSASDFVAAQNKIVLLPVFDQAYGTGSGGWYQVYGYVAFKLTGYKFQQANISWNDSGCNKNCVKGYFTQFVDLDDAFTYSATAPDLGAEIIKLTS